MLISSAFSSQQRCTGGLVRGVTGKLTSDEFVLGNESWHKCQGLYARYSHSLLSPLSLTDPALLLGTAAIFQGFAQTVLA